MNETLLSLEHLLHSQGLGSRKQCRILIEEGHIHIDNQVCTNPKSEWNPLAIHLKIDNVTHIYREQVYIVLHKPAGYECSRSPQYHSSVFTLLPDHFARRSVQPVGRLDHDTTGLLLLTDQGNWAHTLMSPKRHVEKEYRIQTKHPLSDHFIETLRNGVQLRDQPDSITEAQCEQTGSHTLHLCIHEGRYHQVKRMVAAAGNRVEMLHRFRIGNFSLPSDLEEGHWRDLSLEEISNLSNHNKV